MTLPDLLEVAARLQRLAPRRGTLDVLNMDAGTVMFGTTDRVTVPAGPGVWALECPTCLGPVLFTAPKQAERIHIAAMYRYAHRIEAVPAPDGATTLILVAFQLRARPTVSSPPGPPVTARQLQVLQLLSEGLDKEEIAQRLGVTTDTVRTHTANIRERLGARNSAHAVAIVLRQGLLT